MDNKEIRALILKKLYDHYQEEPFGYVDKKNLGIDVPQNIIDGNLKYLEEKRLIKVEWGIEGEAIARITSFGIDVIENPEDFREEFSINFNIIHVRGNINAPVIQGREVKISSSFNELKEIVKEKEDIEKEEREEIIKKLTELEEILSSEKISKTKLQQLMKFFSNYGWLFPSIIEIIKQLFGL